MAKESWLMLKVKALVLIKSQLPFYFLLFALNAVNAQDTTITTVADTPKVTSQKTFRILPEEHSPKVAGIASAIVPGLGQVYNKKYWKVPIVYAGLATAGYFIYYNYTIYDNFKKAYDFRVDDDTATNHSSFDIWYITSTQTFYLDGYENSQLQSVQDSYRSNLDLSVIAAAAVYALNIIDAIVDAHLYDFDVGDDLSLNVKPFITPPYHSHSGQGVTLTLSFR